MNDCLNHSTPIALSVHPFGDVEILVRHFRQIYLKKSEYYYYLTYHISGCSSNHSGSNSFPWKTNAGARLLPSAETHSMIVTSSRLPLHILYFVHLPRGIKYFLDEAVR